MGITNNVEESHMEPTDSQDIYWDGRHYDLKYRDLKEDIPFYLKKAQEIRDPILELACGTGRITIPLAERGYDVTGLDISEPMLKLARKKALDKGLMIEWIKGDIRDFRLEKKFKLIILPFSSIAHLHDLESIKRCFSCVKEQLTNDGRFIIDYFNPRLDYLLRDPNEQRSITTYPDPDGKGIVEILESNIYDAKNQINRIKWTYMIGDSMMAEMELNMRIFYPQELDALIRLNGFEIVEKYGNNNETPFESDSSKQVIVCRKA
jgi:SAM-dependent methyltransferase